MYKLIQLGTKVADDALAAGLKWLSKRRKNVSKHVGYHTVKAANAARRNSRYLSRALGKSPHSIFRDPRPAKLVERALKKPDQVVQQVRNGRIVVEKAFNRAIGKAGEKVIRIVIDPKTGRIITAFPVAQLLITKAAGAEVPREAYGAVFDENVMRTIDEVDRRVARYAHRKQVQEDKNYYWDLLIETALTWNPIGLLFYASPAGDPDESFIVELNWYIEQQSEVMIKEVEQAVETELSPTVRQQFKSQFYKAVMGLGVPYPAD